MKVKDVLDKTFGPPTEGIKFLREFTSGESGKRLDAMLARAENLAKDAKNLERLIELLKLVQELDKQGTLFRLQSILEAMPKGKAGANMLEEVNRTITQLEPKLDKLTKLANTIMAIDQ